LNDFGYVFASFLADDVIAIAGQLYQGAYPHGSFVLGAAEFRFGDKLDLARNFHAFSTNNPNSGKSAADVWVYKGNTHVIAETQKGTLAYYFKPAKKSWADCDAPVCVLTNVHRARFAEDERNLRLITGSVDGNALMVRTISKAKCNAPINWPFVKGDNVPVPERLFAQPSAVYSESRGYQTTHVVGSSFAIVGHYPEADAKILQVTLSH
jgi:hypothetical protein